VFLGDEMGFILLLSNKASYASFANYNDTVQFIQNKTGCGVHLCPTFIVREQNCANIQKIQSEQQNIVHVTVPDLLYDMQQQGLNVQPHVYDLLMSTDVYGNFLFYGVQYGVDTPSLVYPHAFPGFVRANHAAIESSVPVLLDDPSCCLPERPHLEEQLESSVSSPQSSWEQPSQKQPQTLFVQPNDVLWQQMHQSTLLQPASQSLLNNTMGITNGQKHRELCEVMCDVFTHKIQVNSTGFSDAQGVALFDFRTQQGADYPAHMSLEWSELTIGLVQKMTRMQQIDTMSLLPHATFSNHFGG